MTRKSIILIGTGVIVILGVIGSFYVYKNVNDKPPVVVEQTSNSQATDLPLNSDEAKSIDGSLKGIFKGADAVHSGTGAVKVSGTEDKPILSFESDFEVTQGPDLVVYLSPNVAGEDLGKFASLGPLKSTKGAQTYDLPVNYKDYKTVIVWCRAFSVTFATAELQ